MPNAYLSVEWRARLKVFPMQRCNCVGTPSNVPNSGKLGRCRPVGQMIVLPRNRRAAQSRRDELNASSILVQHGEADSGRSVAVAVIKHVALALGVEHDRVADHLPIPVAGGDIDSGPVVLPGPA